MFRLATVIYLFPSEGTRAIHIAPVHFQFWLQYGGFAKAPGSYILKEPLYFYHGGENSYNVNNNSIITRNKYKDFFNARKHPADIRSESLLSFHKNSYATLIVFLLKKYRMCICVKILSTVYEHFAFFRSKEKTTVSRHFNVHKIMRKCRICQICSISKCFRLQLRAILFVGYLLV